MIGSRYQESARMAQHWSEAGCTESSIQQPTISRLDLASRYHDLGFPSTLPWRTVRLDPGSGWPGRMTGSERDMQP